MAAQFTPPPTYAAVVLYDENAPDVKALLRSVRFNPIWLRWFIDVAQFITASGGGGGGGPVTSVTGTAPIVSSGGTTPVISITGSALTRTSDTNVTLTLGGAPTSALLAATSLTLGWTGTLAVSRGGTGLSALGTGVATALGVNVGTAGAFVVNAGALGTPASGTLTNATGLPAAGVTGTALVAAAIGATVQAYDADLTTWAGITPGANVGTALAVAVGSAGAFVTFNGAGGTPSSLTLTNATGLPVAGGGTGYTVRPGFLATPAGATNVTGDGTVYNVAFATEIYDTNGDFATPSFTAPVTAKYNFSCAVLAYPFIVGHTQALLELVTSNRTYTIARNGGFAVSDVIGALTLSGSVIGADMDASDTAKVQLSVSGGTKTVGVLTSSHFSAEMCR